MGKVHSAKVEDPFGQAGPSTPVTLPQALSLSTTIALNNRVCSECGYDLRGLNVHARGCSLDPYPRPQTVTDLCSCGMAARTAPHLCIIWHPALLQGVAPAELTKVIRAHVGPQDRTPIVSIDMKSPMTLAYIRQLLGGAGHLVRWLIPEGKLGLHDDEGRRLTFQWGDPDEYGVQELTVTATEDPAWVKRIVALNTVERSPSAMPTCCDRPDPRIAKSGRPFCANCKRYLDKVPKPVEGPTQPAEVPK